MTRPLVNFVAFQLGWFAVILGAAAGHPWVGPTYVALWLTWHLQTLGKAWPVEAKLIFLSGMIGYTADSLLVLGGWLSFPEHTRLGSPSPLWMVFLWMAFAATLRHALGWLGGRYTLSAALGFVFGPLAYWGGARLGAVMLPDDPTLALVMVGGTWMVAMPLLVWIRARCEGDQTAQASVGTVRGTHGC